MAEVCESPCPTCGAQALTIKRRAVTLLSCEKCGSYGEAKVRPHEGGDSTRRTVYVRKWIKGGSK